MRSPYNPDRRNRNIGTPKRGHGQNNRMVVPQLAAAERSFTAVLNQSEIVWLSVGGKSICFIVEKTSGGCAHACTVDDVHHMLSHIPPCDWAGLETFVLRQSTRKSRLLNPAWGRLFYHAQLGFRDGTSTRSGPALILEASEVGGTIEWPTSLVPDDATELAKLRTDGHRIERLGRRYIISTDADSVRATQLYRTLPHEIGHWFDWLEKVEAPAARGEEFDRRANSYFARPKSERETFAHRYADNLRRTLEGEGVIPFQRIGPASA